MTDDAPRRADAHEGDERVADARRIHLTEDWLACLVGLGLLVLALTGVVPEGLVP